MTYRSIESILVRDDLARAGCENAPTIAVGLAERFRLDALGVEVY
jgi:hypothetical protein